MRRVAPGIAKTDATGRRSFRELLRQAREVPCAREALAFAYLDLEPESRLRLIQAVLEEQEPATEVLGAMLAVEPDRAIATRLADALQARGDDEVYATLDCRVDGGEACLVQRRFGFGVECLRVSWKQSEVQQITIESRSDLQLRAEPPSPVPEVAETVAELLWPYLRAGGVLPEGASRFARFFSIA